MVTSNLPRPRRHPAWQSDVAQDSARSNSIFYMGLAQQFGLFVFFLSVNFWLGSWAKPNIAAFFIVGSWPSKIVWAIIFWSWSHQSDRSHLSSSHTLGPLDRKFKSAQIIFINGFHKSGFHSTRFQITYIINISNKTLQM